MAVEADVVGADPVQPRAAVSPIAGTLTLIALVTLCLIMINTGVQILPGDPLSTTVPVLSVLTVQRVLIIVGLLCLVIAAPRLSTFATPVDIPIVGLLALAGLSLIRVDQPLSDWRALATAAAVLYLTVGVLRVRADAVPVLLVCVTSTAFVASTVAVQQFAQGEETTFSRSGLTNADGADAGIVGDLIRATGTFTNPNLLAGFLLMVIPLVVVLLRSPSLGRFRVGWAVGCAVIAAGLVVTFSRGPIFAAVVVGLVSLVLIAARKRDAAWARVTSIGPVLVSVAAVGLLIALATGLIARLSGRGELWDAALAAAGQGGATGVGYGRAGDVMTALSTQDGGGAYAHAHNIWLNWLVDVGPLGPLLITALLAVAVLAGLRRAAAGSVVAAGAVAGIAAVSIASLIDHPTTVSRNLFVLLFLIGCAVADPLSPGDPQGRHVVGAWRRGATWVTQRQDPPAQPVATDVAEIPSASASAPSNGLAVAVDHQFSASADTAAVPIVDLRDDSEPPLVTRRSRRSRDSG